MILNNYHKIQRSIVQPSWPLLPPDSVALSSSASILALFCACLSTATIYRPRQLSYENKIKIEQSFNEKRNSTSLGFKILTDSTSNSTNPKNSHGPLVPNYSSGSHCMQNKPETLLCKKDTSLAKQKKLTRFVELSIKYMFHLPKSPTFNTNEV